MAGGEGAKERRRLKRLVAQQKNTPLAIAAPQVPVTTPNENPGNERTSRGRDKRRLPSGGQQRRQFHKNHSQHGENINSNNTKTKKKPKIKKPKHLKRKLEQVSNEDEAAKEEIRKKIENFEAEKKLYSKHRNKPDKRRKTSNAESGDATTQTNDNNTHSRLNKLNHNEDSSFPRSGKTAENKAVDNNDGIIVQEETATSEDTIRRDVPNTKNSVSDSSDGSNSSSDDDSDDGNVGNDAKEDTAKSTSAGSSTDDDSNAGGNSDNDDSDENSEEDSDNGSEEDDPIPQRERGRRRRGRQDTAKQMETVEKASETKTHNAASSSTNGNNESGQKTSRYCIGRKPVTDFVIGQTHPATVVYVKPFGVFFDIGCHSDAFCHVSRLSDDFVESPESMFNEGDKVPSLRIVEIDREKKRITVSLQSEKRLEDERHSNEARKSRKEKLNAKKTKTTSTIIKSSGHNRFEIKPRFTDDIKTSVSRPQPIVARAPPATTKDPSSMTPAELKRARKLARRAERRAQAEQ